MLQVTFRIITTENLICYNVIIFKWYLNVIIYNLNVTISWSIQKIVSSKGFPKYKRLNTSALAYKLFVRYNVLRITFRIITTDILICYNVVIFKWYLNVIICNLNVTISWGIQKTSLKWICITKFAFNWFI